MRQTWIVTLVLFVSVEAFAAAPTITGGGGYSNFTSTGTPVFYGGIAGTTPTGNGTDVVDTCIANGQSLTACNKASIYGSLALRVTATHTDAGNLLISKSADRVALTAAAGPNSDYAAVTWNTLCNNFTTTPGNCDVITTGGTGQFKIWIDKNRNNIIDNDEEGADFQVKVLVVGAGVDIATAGGQGITDFTPYPGDEKVYIEDPLVATGTLTTSWGSTATKVRVFSSINNMTEATPGSGLDYQDLPIVANSLTLDNSIVDGLTNGQRTWFRIGIVDEAGNVALLFPDANAESCDTGGDAQCKYAATPDEVLGMLTNDLNCFVATAAYGSALEPKLNTFREFRYKRLLPYSWGRKFVKWYYHYGPYLARYIHDKPVMRASARVLLWPAYGFTRIALSFGIYPAIAFTMALMSILLALPFLRVRKLD